MGKRAKFDLDGDYFCFWCSQILIVDPSLKEELIMDGRMTFTLNSHRELCAVQKAGGTPVLVETILQCARIAAVKVEEISELIQRSLAYQDSLKKHTFSISSFEVKFKTMEEIQGIQNNFGCDSLQKKNFLFFGKIL